MQRASMIRAGIIVFIVFLIFGCDRTPKSESVPSEKGGRHMYFIDYAHVREGVLYHGTLSDADGSPKATWTYEDQGKKVTHDRQIDQAVFDTLWRTITNSEFFQRHRVSAAGKQIDPERFHVLGIAFDKQGKKGHEIFLVPADETDPEFIRWLDGLRIPNGSR